jgi:dethiobiotin synthetase
MSINYFVTGIDTDSGKTLASAILCEALQYDYWKPIQAGLPKDSDTVKQLSPKTKIHPEAYLLNTPASPHAAAKIDGIDIHIKDIFLPRPNQLIIEGAGGCLVPLNDSEFVIDLATHFNVPVILVADLYLGSINHTLLTVQVLRAKQRTIKGIIFNGLPNPESERIILHHSQLPRLLHIHREGKVDSATVKKYAAQLTENWHE